MCIRDRCRTYFTWGTERLCGRWVPHLLTADQKCVRMKISEQCLERFNKNKADFVRRFITVDKTWIHHYIPESKQQSKQWTEAGCSAPKSIPSAGKVVASVFWDPKHWLRYFVHRFLEKGATITGVILFQKLDEKILQRKSGLRKNKKSFFTKQCTCPQKCLAI